MRLWLFSQGYASWIERKLDGGNLSLAKGNLKVVSPPRSKKGVPPPTLTNCSGVRVSHHLYDLPHRQIKPLIIA
jgi:hypothetical protein